MTIQANFIGSLAIDVSIAIESSQDKLIVIYFPGVGKKGSHFISILIGHVVKGISNLPGKQIYHHQLLRRYPRGEDFVRAPFYKIVQVRKQIFFDPQRLKIDLIYTIIPDHYVTVFVEWFYGSERRRLQRIESGDFNFGKILTAE